MTMKHCDEMRDDFLPGYALGALDPTDEGEATSHLGECPDCQEEAERLAEVLHIAFGQSVPPAVPSPLVRTQFLARLALEMQPAQARSVQGRPASPVPPLIVQSQPGGEGAATRRPLMMRWVAGAAAVPAVIAVVFGFAFFNMKGQLDDQRSHSLYVAFADTPHVAMPMQGPALRYGMTGEVIMPMHGSSGLVIVSGMHDASGTTFTCWLHRDGVWVTTGSLRPDASGIAMVVMNRDMDLHQADKVAITMDRAGQVPATPSQPVLSTAL